MKHALIISIALIALVFNSEALFLHGGGGQVQGNINFGGSLQGLLKNHPFLGGNKNTDSATTESETTTTTTTEKSAPAFNIQDVGKIIG